MESAGLRRREFPASHIKSLCHEKTDTSRSGAPETSRIRQVLSHDESKRGIIPPKFVVNLALRPEDRYTHIASHLTEQISSTDLPGIFDELVSSVAGPHLARSLHLLARLALRRVHSSEETRELRGISRASGTPIHLLVAFNVLLDLLLGCTSGGIRVEDEEKPAVVEVVGSKEKPVSRSRILHFRTLDWGMDPLRKIVVELDFVRRAGGPVIATSVTYFGYVGVLTGVRTGLSMSLNFRPCHDGSTPWKRFAFRLQQLMVVLGLRQSISSVLRGYLLGERAGNATGPGPGPSESSSEQDIQRILRELARSPSTAAYLVFCTPQHVYSVEKDNRDASVQNSAAFLTTCNHDVVVEDESASPSPADEHVWDREDVTGMNELVAYSVERKKHVESLWNSKLHKRSRTPQRQDFAIRARDLLHIVHDREVSNDETHYAVIMDPASGDVLWRRVYEAEG